MGRLFGEPEAAASSAGLPSSFPAKKSKRPASAGAGRKRGGGGPGEAKAGRIPAAWRRPKSAQGRLGATTSGCKEGIVTSWEDSGAPAWRARDYPDRTYGPPIPRAKRPAWAEEARGALHAEARPTSDGRP